MPDEKDLPRDGWESQAQSHAAGFTVHPSVLHRAAFTHESAGAGGRCPSSAPDRPPGAWFETMNAETKKEALSQPDGSVATVYRFYATRLHLEGALASGVVQAVMLEFALEAFTRDEL